MCNKLITQIISMKKKIILFFTSILTSLILLISIPNSIYAANVIDDLGGDLEAYNMQAADNTTKMTEKYGKILGGIQTIGMVLSIIILMVVGIKYMVASVEEKAEYKTTFIHYIIGAFLLFTGTLLPSIIYNLVNQLD